jgi:hypothetical protein
MSRLLRPPPQPPAALAGPARRTVVLPPDVHRTLASIAADLTEAFQPLNEFMRRFNEQLAQARAVAHWFESAGVLPAEPPLDPRARALELRRNRNTGPPLHRRAPCSIEPRRAR